MNSKDAFINAISEEKSVKRYRTLRKVLNEDASLKDKFQELKQLQKKKMKYKDEEIEKKYCQLYEEIKTYPFMEEYFELINEIDSINKLISEIIEQEL